MNARRAGAAAQVAPVAAKTTVNIRRRGALAVVATAVVATASLGATATAYAKHGDGDTRKDVRKSVACGSGLLKLKASTDDGKQLELEAEVDSNRAGHEWTVALTRDGKTVWTGKRITAGASGSFSVGTTVAADGADATPTQSPGTSTTTTSAPTTGAPTGDDDGSSSTTTSDDDGSPSATTGDDDSSSSTSTSDDSTPTATTPATTTGEDNPGRSGDDHPKFRLSSKSGDDKGGNPATGTHVIGVTASLGTLTCVADLMI